jgi:adenylate cyclase
MNPTDAYMKARSAAIMTYVGEPHFALALVDEAEALDPLLPVWCVEERGVALYALGRYQESLDSLARLVFQTFRSRLYRAASLVALERSEEAHKPRAEAVVGNPGLTIARFIHKERYRDLNMRTRCADA